MDPLEEARSLYFTNKASVERALEAGPEDVEALEKLAAVVKYLGSAAARVRHNLPERRVEEPTIAHSGSYRYFVLHPDGEVVANCYYVQRPAAWDKAQALRRNRPELRLWDDREKKWIEVEG